jgi:HK97 family phage prohead protease
MPKIERRSAIAVHHTGTSDAAWDGSNNEARLKLDQHLEYYEHAYAWRDEAKDESNKSSYRFIHHEVSEDGAVGAASIRACQAGIAVLNGARGGTTIPHHDRQGVYNHLAAHLRDAKVEPSPLRSNHGDVERRFFGPSEFRVAPDRKSIEGHAAVFNSRTSLPFFDEQVAEGAFSKTIKENDIRALFNHDPNFVLGRNKSKTLELSEDSKGLLYRITPPNAQWARDLMESMDRGDVSQSSFGFRTIKDAWDQSVDPILRTLQEVRLFDVSAVTFPQYEETDCSVRGEDRLLGQAVAKLNVGAELTKQELDLVRAHVGALEARQEAGSPAAGGAEVTEPGQETARHSNDLLLRRLKLAEQEI